MRRSLIASVTVIGLALAACGSDGGDDTASDSTGPADSAEPDPTTDPEGSTPDTDSAPTTPATDIDPNAVFRWGHAGLPPTLDPIESTSATLISAFGPIFDTLTEIDASGELGPGIATDWEFSDDGLTLTLTIDEGLTFQDGSPLDADAVVANLERAREGTATAAPLAAVSGVEAADATTVVLTLSQPAASLPASLGDYAGMMVAPASFDDPAIATHPIGSGPFRVVENTEVAITYERWDEYAGRNQTQLAGIEFRPIADDAARLNALRSGQIDATYIRTTQVGEAESAGLNVDQVPRVQVYGYLINPDSEPALANPVVRRALMHAVDREAVNVGLYDGGCNPTVQYFPDTFWAYSSSIDDDEFGAYDLDLAAELLGEAGESVPALEIMTAAIPTYSNLAVVVQEELGKIGIESSIREVEATAVTVEFREGNFDIAMWAFDTARPDPVAVFANLMPGRSFNPSTYEIPGLEDAIDEIESSTGDDRIDAIHAATELALSEGSLIIPICTPLLSVASAENVSGLQPPVLGNYRFTNVTMAVD